MVRRAFPAAFRPVPDDRILVRIRREFASAPPAAVVDPAAADFVSLSPDWFDWRYRVLVGEADEKPPWPDVVEVRIEQTAAELEAEGASAARPRSTVFDNCFADPNPSPSSSVAARRRTISPFFPLIGFLPMIVGLLSKKCKEKCECA